MDKNSRSGLNPFTGKSHFDIINDDKFLRDCANQYYSTVNQSILLDNTVEGQLVSSVSSKLIGAVEDYLMRIGRYDYIEDYYEWDFHLIQEDTVNAFCMPGGKIIVYSGILQVANTEDKLAFILGHEMAHALLDHTRTRVSKSTAKNGLTGAAWLGGLALDLLGNHEAGTMIRAASNIADIGSELFLLQPYGRANEIEADKLGMMIIHLAGYNIYEIPMFWESMGNLNANNFDFFSTHPTDSKRIQAMYEVINEINNGKDFYNKPLLSNTGSFHDNGTTRNFGLTSGAYAPVTNLQEDNTGSMFCDKCGTRVSINDSYCFNCGNNLKQDTNICQNCGNPVNIGDSYCTRCGNKL